MRNNEPVVAARLAAFIAAIALSMLLLLFAGTVAAEWYGRAADRALATRED